MKKYLITGLLIWIPLAITIWVLELIVSTMDQSLLLLPPEYQPQVLLGYQIPGLGALLTLVVVFVTGVLASNILGQRLLWFWEYVLGRIPVVKTIYNSVKQVSDTLFAPGGQAFSRALLGQSVTLCGWAHRRRDHGGVIFIDLRDREGLAQVVSDPDRKSTFATAEKIRNEYVLKVTGVVRRRPEGTINPNIASGEVEVLAHSIEILNPSLTPPFQLDEENLSETVRLTHRVLDLRREPMQKNLKLRYRVAMAVRKYLDAHGFIDIETPMLTRSTPEGARDYLVPSRLHAGEFFALPQSPQLFKQLLMIAGFDRYYQITRCFRDEDLRADRQPEFTQIDCETSFLEETEIRAIFEGMIRGVFKEALGVALPDPFPVMTYADAMREYGSDKPDLRVPLKFTELTEVMKSVDFKVFSGPANTPGHRVAGLLIPRGGELTRGEIDAYTEFVGVYGAKGLAWIKFNDVSKGRDGMQSPIVKNLSDTALSAVVDLSG